MKMKTQFTIALLAVGSLCFANIGLAAKAGSSPAPAKEAKQEKTKAKKDTAKAESSVSAKDKSFMMKAAKGGMMEVEWGKWAAQNGQSADVKKFGNRMTTDHSKANSELMALASKKGVSLPSHKMSGKWKSDKAYMDMMVKDHEKDLAEFQNEASNGTDPDLKKWAGKTSKMVEKHLAMAKEIQGKLK